MESFAKLRRRHLVKGESISAIARDLNLSRNTVKKYLKADVGPAYRRQQQPCPKLGAFAEQLERWLVQDGLRPKRERRSAKRLFEDLQQAGYAGLASRTSAGMTCGIPGPRGKGRRERRRTSYNA